MGDEFTKSWRFEGWLDAYQLNRNTVLDYFRHSEFYDRTCNNETALMQQFDHTKLKLMTGIEYQVDTSINDPSYFLISKQYRESPKIVKTLVLYYIVGQDPLDQTGIKRGTVFPLPDMYSVFRYNMESALYYVNSAFEELADNISYEVGQPYTW